MVYSVNNQVKLLDYDGKVFYILIDFQSVIPMTEKEVKILSYKCGCESEVTRSRPTLCDPIDCSPPGSSIHGILQARILEWLASPFSRGSSQPRDRTWVSRIAGRFFTI